MKTAAVSCKLYKVFVVLSYVDVVLIRHIIIKITTYSFKEDGFILSLSQILLVCS